MNVLVTGHLGYIGPILVNRLLDAGHTVVGLDADFYRHCTFNRGGQLRNVPGIIKDLRDVTVDDIKRAEVDAVCHLAALSNDPLSNLNPQLTYDINHKASVHLAEMTKQAGVGRFVFSSSCSLYGANSTDDLLDESADFNPVTPYGETKMLAERDIKPLADGDFSPVFLRNSTAYGTSPRLRFDLVINNLVAWAMATGKILIKSDGTPWRPLVHVEDISMGFQCAIEAPREAVHAEAFNIGKTSENHRVSELADAVAKQIPGTEIEYAPGGSPDKRCYRVNCEKAATRLPGFKPTWDIHKGIAQLHECFKGADLKTEDFEGDRYQRVAHIRRLLSEGTLQGDLRRAA